MSCCSILEEGNCKACQMAKSCKCLRAVKGDPALKGSDRCGEQMCGEAEEERKRLRKSCVKTEKMGVVED